MKSSIALFKEGYVSDWPEIAERVKTKHGYCCEICGHKHEPKTGYCLTVHHLDRDKKNNEDYNLASACQRCHLRLEAQAKWLQKWGLTVFENNLFSYESPELSLFGKNLVHTAKWFKPHLEGYLRFKEGNGGKETDRS